MERTIEERKGIKRGDKRKKKQNEENRRVRKIEKQIKEVRQVVAWAVNELNRRKIKRKATKKEKKIIEKLEKWADQQIKRNDELLYVKERALDELRYHKVKLERTRNRNAKIRNNRMFEEDQAIFFRKAQGAREKKGKVPKIKKFEDFWQVFGRTRPKPHIESG